MPSKAKAVTDDDKKFLAMDQSDQNEIAAESIGGAEGYQSGRESACIRRKIGVAHQSRMATVRAGVATAVGSHIPSLASVSAIRGRRSTERRIDGVLVEAWPTRFFVPVGLLV
jgi:hypothetical protein